MDSYKTDLILPKENNVVKSNTTFNANGHDFVEIAGIKWATMNVGANDVTDYGLYFQWGDVSGYTADQVSGDTKPKKAFNSSDYKWYDTSKKEITKYNTTDGKTVLDLEDDAVHANWGGSWRMPTKQEFETLLNAVTKTWTTGYNGTSVAGYELHDKTSNDTLFLPACGYAVDGAVGITGIDGDYWLSSLYAGNVSVAYGLGFGSGDAYVDVDYRFYGLCVRGVLADK